MLSGITVMLYLIKINLIIIIFVLIQQNIENYCGIIKSKKKVLVGPLYTVDGFHELTEYANKFKNLRIACLQFQHNKL